MRGERGEQDTLAVIPESLACCGDGGIDRCVYFLLPVERHGDDEVVFPAVRAGNGDPPGVEALTRGVRCIEVQCEQSGDGCCEFG